MAVAIALKPSPQSQAVLDGWKQRPQKTAEALGAAMDHILIETAAHIQATKLSGEPVGVRSGLLRRDLTHEKTGLLLGIVGTTSATAAYARSILGPEDTVIRPKSAKHLWVPVGRNVTPSGARYTPRGLYETFGKQRIRIFHSKAGNLVVFVADPKVKGKQSRYKRATKGGRKAGDLKGQLMFVLKDEVTIQGTDALAAGAGEMIPRMQAILNQHLEGVAHG